MWGLVILVNLAITFILACVRLCSDKEYIPKQQDLDRYQMEIVVWHTSYLVRKHVPSSSSTYIVLGLFLTIEFRQYISSRENS